jgi:hypothetical protein
MNTGISKFLVFHAGAVDSSSVTAHDAGTNVDLACFPASAITAVMGEEDFVYVYFEDAGRFEGSIGSATEVMEQSFVRLGCAEGKEFDVVKDFSKMLNSFDAKQDHFLFDSVNGTYAIPNVTSVQIRRHLTTHTIASDS